MSNGIDASYFRQAWQYFSRIYVAQIDSVNPAKGTVTVIFLDGLNTKREELEMSLGSFSMKGHKSSWDRSMPQVGDLLYVGFGSHGEARVLGTATLPGMYSDFIDQKTFNPSAMPVGDLTDLALGEWDKRSSGGAYLYGDKNGNLLMSAGPTVQMRLNKKNNDARSEAGLWAFNSIGSFVRIGDVKRTLIATDFKETLVDFPIPLDPLALKEWWLHLENPPVVPLGPRIQVVDEKIGAVRNTLGLPHLGAILNGALPLRYRKKIWTPGTTNFTPIPLAVFSNEIDALGNQEIDYGLETKSVNVSGGPLTALDASFLSISASAATSAELHGDIEAKLTSGVTTVVDSDLPLEAGGGVKIGGLAAIDRLVKGTTFMATMEPIWLAISQFSTTLATVLPIIQTKLGIAPPTPDGASFEAAITAATALAALSTPFAVAIATPLTNPMLSQKAATT